MNLNFEGGYLSIGRYTKATNDIFVYDLSIDMIYTVKHRLKCQSEFNFCPKTLRKISNHKELNIMDEPNPIWFIKVLYFMS